jgi:hypothetical protein
MKDLATISLGNSDRSEWRTTCNQKGVRIFPTKPAPAATAEAGPSSSKSSGDLFGQHLAGASQATLAQAHPSSGDGESSQASEAQISAQTSSKNPQPSSPQSPLVSDSSASSAESSARLLLPPAVLALLQPATDLGITAAATLKPKGDPKAAPSQAGKPAKDGEGNSLQKTEGGRPATAGNQQLEATVPVPVLMSIVVGSSIRGDGAQNAAAAPDVLKLAAEGNANPAKQAPQHATVEGFPATELPAHVDGQQLSEAGVIQLPQENFALPAIASSTPTTAPSAPAVAGLSAAQSGKDSQKGSADLQAKSSSGSPPSGQESGNSASAGTLAVGPATPAAQSGASPSQQGNAPHAAVLQAGGLATNGAQGQAPVLHALAQAGGAPRSSLEGAAPPPRAPDARGDASDHLADAAQPASGTRIDSARLIQTINQTEMHVGMHSADFGDISIRASLAQQQVMAQISVNHDELSQAMMAHLATVQTKIGNDYGLQASISVHHQGTATVGQGGGQSHQQQQRPHTRSSSATSPAQPSVPEMMAHPIPAAAADRGYRLDIQA